MFSALQKDELGKIRWASHSLDRLDVGFIEAPQRSAEHATSSVRVHSGFIPESDLGDWLQQSGEYAASIPYSATSGGIRLLFLERRLFRPPSFAVSEESYLQIEEQFHLAPGTLSILSNDAGLHARFLEYDSNDSTKLKRLRVVMKATQKFQIGNYGLSYSHDFENGLSTGIVHGTDLFRHESEPFSNMIESLEAMSHLWTHPLALPVALLRPYISRLEYWCLIHLDDSVVRIQQALGTSRAGRLTQYRGPFEDPVGDRPIHAVRDSLQGLTGQMSTCLIDIIYLSKLPQWLESCTDLLLKTLDEVQPMESMSAAETAKRREVKECLEYLKAAGSNVGMSLKCSRDIINAEFNVLYSHISQVDNRLNAKMAASTSRDSTAMKALAGITAVFLPSTAVATIFSMSMFDWQNKASEDDTTQSRTVSSNFWIYWVVSIPLTLLVGIVLKFWWAYEKRNIDRDILNEIEGIDKVTEPVRQDGQKVYRKRSPKRKGQ